MGVFIGDNKLKITETINFHFYFDLPKDVDKHKIDHIIKHNGYLAEQRIKNEIDQQLCKYKHGSNVHEHRK